MRQAALPRARLDAIAIGGSAGSIEALGVVLPALPAGFHAALLVVLHLPRERPSLLCNIFRQRCALPVREAGDGEEVLPGHVLIAPAGWHLTVRKVGRGVRTRLSLEPADSLHRPSADVTMASAARVWGARLLGVVMTGMGNDGAAGLKAIRQHKGRTLAESEETAVIYGMPKAAVEAGVVDREVPLHAIADEIVAAV